MEYQIRRGTINDLGDIVDLWQKLSYDQLSKDEYYEGEMVFEGGKSQFERALRDSNCAIFVGLLDGNIVGFSEVWLHNKDFHFFIDDYGYILHFYIDVQARKDERTLGLIFKLYGACEDWAVSKGKKYLVADFFEHNRRLMKGIEKLRMKCYRRRYVKKL